MRVKQVSIFVENHPGRLAEVLAILAKENINIRALAIADTADFGILRMMLSDVEKGIDTLRKANMPVRTTEVLLVEVPDVPGGLNEYVVTPLAKASINVEYMYAQILPTPGKASVLVKVKDIDKAEKILTQKH